MVLLLLFFVIAVIILQTAFWKIHPLPVLLLGAFLFGHFRLGSASALEAVKKTKHPILLIHGEADSFVPCDMSREIEKACASEIRLETFPDAGHALSFIRDFDRYKHICSEFFHAHWK